MGELRKETELAKVIRLRDRHDSFVLQNKVTIFEDDMKIAESMHTELLTPDMDTDKIKDLDVRKAAEYYWTPEKVSQFKAEKLKHEKKEVMEK